MKTFIPTLRIAWLFLCFCTFNFLHAQNLDPSNNDTTITFQRAFTDLELSFTTTNPTIGQWESGTFTYTLENKGNTDATGVEVRLYYVNDVVPVGGAMVNTSSGSYRSRSDAQFINIGLWDNITVPAGGTATLEIELFSRVPDLLFCAEVTAADQDDVDSTPLVLGCGGAGEDDHVTFDATTIAGCGFFRQYPNAFSDDEAISLVETSDEFLLQATLETSEEILTLDKEGNLLSKEVVSIAPMPTAILEAVDSQLQFLQLAPNGDTLINELLSVDYPNPTAIVPNGGVRQVSDGFVIGGFIVDTDASQMFRAFFVKTDLNGQSPQTVLIEDLNNTLSIFDIVEDSNGGIYIYWGTSGNFSLSGTSADLSTTWVQQFASDTPSTTVEDIKISQDEQTIYVAVTDNLRGEVFAYNTATGSDAGSGFELISILPLERAENRLMNGLLPLSNGNLLFSARIFSNVDRRFVYGIVDTNGASVWLQTIEGQAIDIEPIAEITDGGFLFATNTADLQVLKTNALGEIDPACNNFVSGQEIDLELTISSDATNIPIWTSATFTLTLTNNGMDRATGVEVALPIDEDRFVQVGGSMVLASVGNYFDGLWSDIELDAGGTAILEIELFNKSNNLEVFAQVVSANQMDIDSEPFNGLCCTANEDDEAVVTISSRTNAIESRSIMDANLQLYPNPTDRVLNIKGLEYHNSRYRIIDLLGRTVQQGQILNAQIEVQHLSSGTYFLQIAGEQTSAIRFVKW